MKELLRFTATGTIGVNILFLIITTNNSSNFIPLYLTKPININGVANIIHNQYVISVPNLFLNNIYIITATIQANKEKMNCLNDNPKYTFSE